MELCILIPAKNEEDSIVDTISNIWEKLNGKIQFNILVINDYSEDSTLKKLEELSKKYLNLNFINNNFNCGVGNAIRFGLTKWKGNYISICMADSSDSPNDILESYNKIITGNYDCIFGSRFIKGGIVQGYPIQKLILNRVFNLIVKLISRKNYNDFTNIFKMYSRNALILIGPIESTGFSIGLEMSLKAFSKNLKIGIIPISWVQRTAGISKLKVFKNIRVYVSTLIKCLKYEK